MASTGEAASSSSSTGLSPSGGGAARSAAPATTGGSSSGSGATLDPWAEGTTTPRESCVKHFDELWFCYSPVFQLQQLYRYGEVDSCQGKWRAFYNCLKKRTKFADQVVDATDPTIWRLRTPEEAATWWKGEFTHIGLETESPEAP